MNAMFLNQRLQNAISMLLIAATVLANLSKSCPTGVQLTPINEKRPQIAGVFEDNFTEAERRRHQ